MAKKTNNTEFKATLKDVTAPSTDTGGRLASLTNKNNSVDSNTLNSLLAQMPKNNLVQQETPSNVVSYSPNYTMQQATEISPYESKYESLLNEMQNNILNREKFSYDFNADPIYQNYKDSYTRQAMLGSENAQAQAAQLSGGYGNSYAATAGALAYQDSMSKLNDVIPQLYEQAMNKYYQDLSESRNDYNMIQSADESAYNRYRDTVADTQWKDTFNADQYNNAMNYASVEHWKAVEQANIDREFDENKRRWGEEFALEQKKFAEEQLNNEYNRKLTAAQTKNVKADTKYTNKQTSLLGKSSGSSSSGRSGSGRSYGSGSSGGSSNKSSKVTLSSLPSASSKTLRTIKNSNTKNIQQKTIARNTIMNLKNTGKITDAQANYLWYSYLGFTDKDSDKVDKVNYASGSTGKGNNQTATKVNIKTGKEEISTLSQALANGAPKSTLSASEFAQKKAKNDSSVSGWKTYTAYLADQVAKGKKKK